MHLYTHGVRRAHGGSRCGCGFSDDGKITYRNLVTDPNNLGFTNENVIYANGRCLINVYDTWMNKILCLYP